MDFEKDFPGGKNRQKAVLGGTRAAFVVGGAGASATECRRTCGPPAPRRLCRLMCGACARSGPRFPLCPGCPDGAETRNFIEFLSGWGTWIRTKINGVRVRCSTVELSPKQDRAPLAHSMRLFKAIEGLPYVAANGQNQRVTR